jgi:hypothetical protein
MDTRDGTIYDSRELAEAAGVPDDDLVTGSRAALEKLRTKLVFTKGSFKPVASCPCGRGGEPWHWPRGGVCTVGMDISADPPAALASLPQEGTK